MDGQISPLGVVVTAPTQARLRTRRLETVRVLALLAAPAVLLIALTVQGWDQVLQTESTTLRVHGAVQRSLRVAALITDLQVERGQTTMLLGINSSRNALPHNKQLLLDRRRSDTKVKLIQDWSYIDIKAITNTTNVKQRPQYFSGYLTWMRALIDKGAANNTFTLNTYTLVIKDLMSSLLGGLQDQEQHIYLPAFHTFMMAGDKVGLLRARGSAIWVSCEGGQAARVAIIRDLAQYVALIEVGGRQSAPLKAAFDKIGLDIHAMVQELEHAIAYLISDTFIYDCEMLSPAGRLQGGEKWFHNMTAYIQRISYVREAIIVALQKNIDHLMYSIKTMAWIYSFIIVLTILCTIGSAFTAFSSVKTSWKLHELSHLLTQKGKEVESERSRCNDMLSQLLPPSIAVQLKTKKTVEPEYFRDATIFFSDIAEFESFSHHNTPHQAVDCLNSLQGIFDQALHRYDVYSIATIGPASMLVSGLPIRNGDTHARDMAHLSLYIQQKTDGWSIQLRIGIHSGPCMAGIIGKKIPRYYVLGDTVNTASKIEASGEPTKIHISESTRDKLDRTRGFVISPNTGSNLQEKLKVKTYWLESYAPPATGNGIEMTLVPAGTQPGTKTESTAVLAVTKATPF